MLSRSNHKDVEKAEPSKPVGSKWAALRNTEDEKEADTTAMAGGPTKPNPWVKLLDKNAEQADALGEGGDPHTGPTTALARSR